MLFQFFCLLALNIRDIFIFITHSRFRKSITLCPCSRNTFYKMFIMITCNLQILLFTPACVPNNLASLCTLLSTLNFSILLRWVEIWLLRDGECSWIWLICNSTIFLFGSADIHEGECKFQGIIHVKVLFMIKSNNGLIIIL